jgi:hypothetical protein
MCSVIDLGLFNTGLCHGQTAHAAGASRATHAAYGDGFFVEGHKGLKQNLKRLSSDFMAEVGEFQV